MTAKKTSGSEMGTNLSKTNIQEKVAVHLLAEEANLNHIQQLLLKVQSHLLQSETGQNERPPDVQAAELLEQCQHLQECRNDLLTEIAGDDGDGASLRHFIPGIRQQAASDAQDNDQYQVNLTSTQERVKKTSAQLQRTAQLLLTKQRHVTLTLSTLGLFTLQTRYNAAGERLATQPSTIMQTRS